MSSPPPKHSLSTPTNSGNQTSPVLPTPSSSSSVSEINNQLRRELEQQIAEKEKQLQDSSSGIGKSVLNRQIKELKERLQDVDRRHHHHHPQQRKSHILSPRHHPQQYPQQRPGTASPSAGRRSQSPGSGDEDLSPATLEKLRNLERDLGSYRGHLSPNLSGHRKDKILGQRTGLDPLPSPSTSTMLPPPQGHDSTSLLPLPPPPTGSTPTKRRSKVPNADRRNTDIEFATEIGQGLLVEVRKMQALVQEKDDQLKALQAQKADLERAAESMAKQLRQKEENEEKLKEETWNLELAKQELTISVSELQQNLNKANAEQKRMQEHMDELTTEIEHIRDREEKLSASLEAMKQRHEQDMATIRRHSAGLQREKTDHIKQLEALSSELAIAKAQSKIAKRSHSDLRPTAATTIQNEENANKIGTTASNKEKTTPGSSPPASPKQQPTRNQQLEVETLKTSLAHAHRMVSNLRSNLHKEKTEKFEFKKLLTESQEQIEQLQNDPRLWVDAGYPKSSSGPNSNNGPDSNNSTSTRRLRKGKRRVPVSKTRVARIPKGVESLDDTSDVEEQRRKRKDSQQLYYSSQSEEDDDDDEYYEVGDESPSQSTPGGFTSLDSELSKSQQSQKKTPSVSVEPPSDETDKKNAPRTLGDELSAAFGGPDSSTVAAVGGAAIAGAAIAANTDSRVIGSDAGVQTDDIPAPPSAVFHEVAIQATTPNNFQEFSTCTIDIPPVSVQHQQVQCDAPSLVHAETQCIPPEYVEQGVQAQEPIPIVVDASAQCEPPLKIETHDQGVQSDAVAGIDQSTQSVVPEPVHMGVQSEAAELTDAAVQSDPKETSDVSVQSDVPDIMDCGIQYEPPVVMEIGVQSEPPVVMDSGVQSEPPVVMDSGVQSDAPDIVDSGVQSEPPVVMEVGNQTEPLVGMEIGTQSEPPVGMEIGTQSELPVGTEIGIQSEPPVGMEIGTQSELPVGTEIGVQSEQVMTKDNAVQSEPAVTKDSSVQYEYDVDPGKDAMVQTDFDTSSSIGAGTAAAAVGAGGLLGGLGALAAKAFGKGDTEDTVDEGEQNESTATVEQKKKVEIAKNCEEPVTILEDGASKSTFPDESAKSRGMKTNNGDDTTTTHIPTNADDDSDNVTSKDTEKPINYADHQEEQGTRSADNALDDNSTRSDKPAAIVTVPEGENSENATVSGKVADSSSSENVMRSTSPADSATDLPNHDKNNSDNDNRMFTKAETDAMIAAAVAAAMANQSSQPAEHKQDDNNNTLNDGHLLTEGTRQISTGESSTSNNIPTKRVLTDLAGKDDINSNNANVPRRGSHQDIPIRPTSPPPAHLLTRVGHGSTISSTHRSSIGSISTSDKGKAPARSQLLRNAQQQQLRNRPSSTMSSLSPSEQRASIASSPYANSLRTEADPSHIGLITQTMIGDWLWKYTRKSVGDQLSDYRHKRYFWIHPYTRTLYWSVRAPGTHGDESKVKSALIEGVTAVPDHNHPPSRDVPNMSLLIQTANRVIKLTAPNMDRHNTWFEALSYLVTGPGGSGNSIGQRSQQLRDTSIASSRNGPGNRGNLMRKPSIQRVQNLFRSGSKTEATSTTDSALSNQHSRTHHVSDDDDDDDDDDDLNTDDEALEDVRMCCNGKHHVSKLERDHVDHRPYYRKVRSMRTTQPTVPHQHQHQTPQQVS